MEIVKNLLVGISKDESGAALVEYSILVALITVATVALIDSVGTKVTTAWTSLDGAF